MPLIIGKAIAGNNRFRDGRTFAEVFPKKYGNVLTDYVNLVIAEAKAKLSRELEASIAEHEEPL